MFMEAYMWIKLRYKKDTHSKIEIELPKNIF